MQKPVRFRILPDTDKDKIRKELLSRDTQCALKYGPNNEYNRSSHVDPYKYLNYKDFVAKNEFKVNTQHCKLMKTINKTDIKNRYFTNMRHRQQCHNARGQWNSKSLNRENFNDNGVCWTKNEHDECGSRVPNELVRPDAKHIVEDRPIVDIVKKNCNADKKCQWQKKGKTSYDCYSKQALETVAKKENTMTPPANMPTDNQEEYLYKWYVQNNPGPAPYTSPLIGEGNRCTRSSKKLDLEEGQEQEDGDLEERTVNGIHIKKLDTRKREEYKTIQKILGVAAQAFHIKLQKLKSEYRPQKDVDELYDAYFKRYYDRYDDFDDGEEVEVKQENTLLPSIPQSVVNMVMKNIVQKKSTNRGLLAWHSTGSGKCLALGTKVIMYDGRAKEVQDIECGDLLMGDDSNARIVLTLGQGKDMMYDIIQSSGDTYTVNSEHILVLHYSQPIQILNNTVHYFNKEKLKIEHKTFKDFDAANEFKDSFTLEDYIINIEIQEYVLLSDEIKQHLKGIKSSSIFFNNEYSLIKYDDHYISSIVNEYESMSYIPDQIKYGSFNTRLSFLKKIINFYIYKDNYSINASPMNYTDLLFIARSIGLLADYSKDNGQITFSGKHVNVLNSNFELNNMDGCYFTNFDFVDIKVLQAGINNYYGFTIDGNHRFLLGDLTITHNTCTAAGVIDAFWDDTRHIIFASSLDAIAANPDYKFHECAYNLYPRFRKEPFTTGEETENVEVNMALIKRGFDERKIRFLSFAKLSNRVKNFAESGKKKLSKLQMDEMVDLNNSILIIDEVHNLFRPLATQRAHHEYLEKLLLNPATFPNMKVVILTATPGDNTNDVLKLLNIVRDPARPAIQPFNISDPSDIMRFKNSIRGLVSFFDMSSDSTKFPKVVDEMEPVKYPMSVTQFNRYVEAYKEVKADSKNFHSLAVKNQTNKYWAQPRRYANMMYNFDKNMNLSDFSSKIPALLENLESKADEKHYVYSAFYENRGYGGHGILAISKELEKLGYEKLTVAEAKRYNKTKTMPSKKKRYILAIQKEIGDEGSSSAGKNLGELIRIYNNSANIHGDYVHIMLASQGFNEGIDLRAVRHIHIFEPLVTWASDKQTIGRAARYCSHGDLDRDKGQWLVEIHRYMSDVPITLLRPNIAESEQKKTDLNNELEMLIMQLDDYDKKTQKAEIKEAKAEIAAKKKEIKEMDKEAAKAKKVDTSNIKNIEQVIFDESRQRMHEILLIYQIMKECAIDCRILQEFHSSTGNDLKCELYNGKQDERTKKTPINMEENIDVKERRLRAEKRRRNKILEQAYEEEQEEISLKELEKANKKPKPRNRRI